MKRKFIWIFTLLWLSLFLIAAQVVEEFTALEGVILWLIAGGGAMVLFGYIESYLLEIWPAWHNFPYWIKVTTPIVFAGVLGIVGQTILTLDLLVYIPSWAQIVLLAGINYFFTQKAYKSIKDSTYGLTARNGVKPVG